MVCPWQQFQSMGQSSAVRYTYCMSSAPFQSQSCRSVTLMVHLICGGGAVIWQIESFARLLLPTCWQGCAWIKDIVAQSNISRFSFILILCVLRVIRIQEWVSSGRLGENIINCYMFDKQKLKELEQRSHTRGLLSKQFFLNQQIELERKRREMKQELDRQVQERRRQKELQKMQIERQVKKQEQQIKNYYQSIQSREKRLSGNESAAQKNMKNANQPYQTYPNESHPESRVKNGKNKNSKPNPIDGDIPLLSLLTDVADNTPPPLASSKAYASGSINHGAIPLLDLSEEQGTSTFGVKSKKGKQKTKRQKTLQAPKEIQVERALRESIAQKGQQQSRPVLGGLLNDRRSTLADEQSIVGSIVRGGGNSLQKRFEGQYIAEQIEAIQQQNNALKVQLKRSQQAVTLLMGAVRSNGKLQKYRVQAQKILGGGEAPRRQEPKQSNANSSLLLPKINLRHQSIMHDYLISAARRGRQGK